MWSLQGHLAKGLPTLCYLMFSLPGHADFPGTCTLRIKLPSVEGLQRADGSRVSRLSGKEATFLAP